MSIIQRMVSKSDVFERLRSVVDPELGIDVVELGFIYEVDIKEKGSVYIVMTLTTSGCPFAGEIKKMVEDAVLSIDDVDSVDVEFVFDPPWSIDMMSEEARLELGFI